MEHDFSTSAPSNATIGTSATLILAAKHDRRYAIIVNDSTQDIYINFGTGTGLTVNKGLRLNARGGVMEIVGSKPFRGSVYGISATGSANVCTLEA